MIDLTKLTTEQQNPRTKTIDEASALEIVKLINAEDQSVPKAVKKILPDISRAIIVIANRLSHGGRLFYIGSGTSGRLGILDASECPPTYSTPPELVQGIYHYMGRSLRLNYDEPRDRIFYEAFVKTPWCDAAFICKSHAVTRDIMAGELGKWLERNRQAAAAWA